MARELKPEYEDVAAVARRTGQPAHEVARDLHYRALRLVSTDTPCQVRDPEPGVMTSEYQNRMGQPPAGGSNRSRRGAAANAQQSGDLRTALEVHTAHLRHEGGPLQGQQRGDLPEDRDRDRGAGKPDPRAQPGQKVILEAMKQNGQEKNPAAWYYLGRIIPPAGRPRRADTAFTKAEQLAPACKKDITDVRYSGWVPLVNAGITFRKTRTPIPPSPCTARPTPSTATSRSRS